MISVLLLTATTLLSANVPARTWTSAHGNYTVEGEMIAYNETTVVLKRDRSDRLVAIEISELSEADQQFIAEKRDSDANSASETAAKGEEIDPGQWQTWTSAAGWQFRGRVLAFGKKELVVDRRLGAVTVNDKAFTSLDALHQRLVLAILTRMEGQTFENERDLVKWVGTLKGQPKKYALEGVLMQLESGDQIPLPFILFSEKDQAVLRPGWETWLAAEQDEKAREREDFLMQQESMQYQAMQQRAQQHQQMEILKLNLLATATGLTSIWEVALVPLPGTWGRPTVVVVSARNSQQASQLAMQNYPGYTVGPVRRASGF